MKTKTIAELAAADKGLAAVFDNLRDGVAVPIPEWYVDECGERKLNPLSGLFSGVEKDGKLLRLYENQVEFDKAIRMPVTIDVALDSVLMYHTYIINWLGNMAEQDEVKEATRAFGEVAFYIDEDTDATMVQFESVYDLIDFGSESIFDTVLLGRQLIRDWSEQTEGLQPFPFLFYTKANEEGEERTFWARDWLEAQDLAKALERVTGFDVVVSRRNAVHSEEAYETV